jgi:putative SOS response-associated peptidase YedK
VESGPPLLTCCILTTTANDLVRPVHDRMPVILENRYFGRWIDRGVQEPAVLAPMLRPFAAHQMRGLPVSQWVNDARHKDARCLEPAV